MPLLRTRLNNKLDWKTLYFDGVDDYVKVPPYSAMNEITIEFSFYTPTTLGNGSGIVQSYFHALTNKPFIKYDDRIGHQRFEIYLATVNGSDTLYVSQTISKGWYYLVFTYNDPVMRLYLNSTLIGSKTHTYGGAISSPSSIVLATWNDTSGFSEISISLIRIYNRALSDSEILWNYYHPDNPIRSGLVLWLHYDSISGSTWLDKSGNGNDGTIYGATPVEYYKPPYRSLTPSRTLSPTR